jgi:hypothetical protein
MRRFDAYSSALRVLRQAYHQNLSNEFILAGNDADDKRAYKLLT